MKRGRSPSPKDEQSNNILQEIYRPGGVPSDLHRFEQRPKRVRRRALFIILGFALIASIIAILGMSVFSPKEKFSGEDVAVTFDAPEQAASGDDIVVTMNVQNTGALRLNRVELSVRYPDGFQFLSATPKASNEFSNAWSLGNLNGNETKKVRIVGRLIGERGSEKVFFASANYEPSNFSSQFTSEGTHSILINASALDVTLKSPHAITTDQEVTYEVTVLNSGGETLDNVLLEAEFPEGLADPKLEPEPTEGERMWEIGTLEPKKSFSLKIIGKLSGTPGSVTELKIRVGVLDSSSAFLVQRETSALVLILEPTLNLTLTTDGDANGHPVNPRDELPLQLSYSNDSDTDFSDATIELTFTGKDSNGGAVSLVDAEGITSPTPFSKSGDGLTITWTKDDRNEFARLVPGAKGTLEVKLPIKSSVRSLGSGMNLALTVQAKISVGSVGDTGGAFSSSSDELVFPVTTEVRLATESRYYSEEGTELGSGPLPPEVGITTTYVIRWYVTNTLNGAQGVLLKAKLPEGVTFVDSETSGGKNITFDETSREVRWRIDKLDARIGQTLPTLVGQFRVSITPTDEDVDTTPALLGQSTLTAVDLFTNGSLSAKADGVTTDLLNDTKATGKGKVIAAPEATNANTNTES